MRALTTAAQAAIVAKTVRPFYMAEIEFLSGTSYLWTGYGAITWNGHTWTGLGQLAGVSAIQDSSEVEANNLTLTLNGIPAGLVNQALTECQQNYAVRVYLGWADAAGAVIIDPVKCFNGRMDVPTLTDGGETASISITAENSLVALQRASNRRYTAADQALDVAGDRGFEFITAIQIWTGLWGKASGVGPSGASSPANNNDSYWKNYYNYP